MRGCLRVTGALIIDEAVVKSFERLTRCKLQYSVIPSYSRPDESLNLSIAYGYIQTMNHDSPLVIKRIVGWRVMIDWRRAGLDLQSHAHSRADDSPGLTAPMTRATLVSVVKISRPCRISRSRNMLQTDWRAGSGICVNTSTHK
jgi:hypothetical protein